MNANRLMKIGALVGILLCSVATIWLYGNVHPKTKIEPRPEIVSISWDKEGERRNFMNDHGLRSRYVVEFNSAPTDEQLKGCDHIIVELAKRSCFVTSAEKVIVLHEREPEENTVAYVVNFTDGMPSSGKFVRYRPPSYRPSRVVFEDGQRYPDREEE